MVVTDNDVKKLEKHFFSISFLESNKKVMRGFLNRCGGARETIQYFFWPSDDLKYYLCVKCWLCKQEVASLLPTGTSILFYFLVFAIISTMIGCRFME